MRSRSRLVIGSSAIALAALVYVTWDSTHAPESTSPPAPARAVVPPPAIPTEYLPPPFGERGIAVPAAPAMGETPASETAAFCDEGKWSRVDLLVARNDEGVFRVDENAWSRILTGSKAGLASWMSQCHQDGAPIEIVAASTGTLLATYDRRSGLKMQP